MIGYVTCKVRTNTKPSLCYVCIGICFRNYVIPGNLVCSAIILAIIIPVILKYYVPQKWSHFYFPGDPVVASLPDYSGDMGSVPGPERFHMLQDN